MAGLSLGGINLDVRGLVSQLMQVESIPLQRLQAKKSDYESQLSAFGRLKSAMSSFQTSMGNLGSLDKFETYKATTSESATDKTFSATVDKDATAGSFGIQVTQLAQASKYGSDNSSPFVDTDTSTINSSGDALTINVGTDSMNVNVDGLTLQGVRDAINAQAQTDGLSVSASIVSTQSNEHFLIITGTETGTDNAVSLADNNAKTALKFGTGTTQEVQGALNSEVIVDGQYTISSATNTVTNAISGVTLDLLKTGVAPAATLEIERDTSQAKKNINSFVSGFNTFLSTVNALKKDGLEGESSLNSVLNSVRNEFNTSAGLSSSFNFLSEVGITSNAKTGELELDSDKLQKAIDQDYEAVSQLFANDDKGIAFRLEEKMAEYLKYDGLIKTREEGLQARIDYNGEAQDRMNYRLDLTEARFLKKFGDLDTLISQSNSTSSYLTQQLANLPGFTSK